MNTTAAELRIRSVSPDGTVAAQYSHRKEVEVSYISKSPVPHDDAALAAQVRLAIKGLITGYRRARGQTGEPAAESNGSLPAERQRRLRTARDKISVSRRSPRDVVTIELHGAADPEVRIRPRSLANRGPEAVIAEINVALNQALLEYQQLAVKIHKEFYVDSTTTRMRKELRERRDQS